MDEDTPIPGETIFEEVKRKTERDKRRGFVWRAKNCLEAMTKTEKLVEKQKKMFDRLVAGDESAIEELIELDRKIEKEYMDRNTKDRPGCPGDVAESVRRRRRGQRRGTQPGPPWPDRTRPL